MPLTVQPDRRRQWLVATAAGIITIDEVRHLRRSARAAIERRTWPMLFDGPPRRRR